MKEIEVVAAIIHKGDKYLCLQHGEIKYDYTSFKYEFPGGKTKDGESLENALKRELNEELDYTVEIEKKLLTFNHQYPDFTIKLTGFLCHPVGNEFILKEHIKAVWLNKKEMNSLQWAAADKILVNFINKYDNITESPKFKPGQPHLILQLPGNIRGTQQHPVKVVLHSCCAPCASPLIECMLSNNIEPVVLYFNPNIYPEKEYLKRKVEIVRFSKKSGIICADTGYDHKKWLEGIAGLEKEPERGRRCLECFKIRLRETARYASSMGIKIFTTTLASSRWKDLEQIRQAGEYAQRLYPDTVFWNQNWRKGGLSERHRQLLKENGFYNQQYCGCEFSLRQ